MCDEALNEFAKSFDCDSKVRYIVVCPYCPKGTKPFVTSGHNQWEDSESEVFNFFGLRGTLCHDSNGSLTFDECCGYGCRKMHCEKNGKGKCREECQCYCDKCTTFECLYCPEAHIIPVYHENGEPVCTSDMCISTNCKYCCKPSTCYKCYGEICDVCSACECSEGVSRRQYAEKHIRKRFVQIIDLNA